MNLTTSALVVLVCGPFACSGQVQESVDTKPGASSSAGSGNTNPGGSSSAGSTSSQTVSGTTAGNHPDDDTGSSDPDPLVGSWTYSGYVPDVITVTLTFDADNSFTMVETVAPLTTPRGYMPTSCMTTDTYLGTYAEGVAGGTNTLDLTFTGGTANAIVGCASALPGTPLTPDLIVAYRNQGLVPATMNNYTVTSTTLVLTPTSSDPPIAAASCAPSACTDGLATQVTTLAKSD
jgi:hypothetical protein